MNADTHELKTILTLERRYIIPTFQRDYEWTEKGQWALLFEDLEAVADRLEDARRTAAAAGKPIAKAEKTVAPHFLGAIVLDLLPSSAGSLDVRRRRRMPRRPQRSDGKSVLTGDRRAPHLKPFAAL